MDAAQAAGTMQTLSSPLRLALYRLLVSHHPAGLTAGELARQLDLLPSQLTFHARQLVAYQLASATRQGRQVHYVAQPGTLDRLIVYLHANCCAHYPDYRQQAGCVPAC